ncbi:MAG: DUF1592 domain-containing protein [Planctomycetota bacterium]|nr:DUF1592 domain-containing protein [Planctomycetota bacterium]
MRACVSPATKRTTLPGVLLAIVFLLAACPQHAHAVAEDPSQDKLESSFPTSVQTLVQKHCTKCHNPQRSEADVDLTQWSNWNFVQRDTRTVQRVLEQFQSQQMPPPEEAQPAEQDRLVAVGWMEAWLTLQAQRNAGDPGPVLLRRLNNAEYTNTIKDLTHLLDIQPAKEFPADSAAGEGFSNTGAALVMSPSLVRKYLDAAKAVSEHVVLLPHGISFADDPSQSDRTNATLEQIRSFYAPFTDQSDGSKVNLQGIVFETNQGGRLPVEKYLVATLKIRDTLNSKPTAGPEELSQFIESIAQSEGLNSKYLKTLWNQFHQPDAQGLLAALQKRWQSTRLESPDPLIAEVLSWQKALWKFASVGHIGKRDGPKAWQEPVNPIRNQQELRLAIPKEVQDGPNQDLSLYLQISDAGDGNDQDAVVISNPRLVAAGRPDLPLSNLDALAKTLRSQQDSWVEQTQAILSALDGWLEDPRGRTIDELVPNSEIPPALIRAWASTLGLSEFASTDAPPNAQAPNAQASNGQIANRRLLVNPSEGTGGHAFITGWVAEDALSILANSSDQHVRIPGNMRPKSIAVHPSPSRSICTAWKSPSAMRIDCQATVRHAHTECGNGIAWRLELRRGSLHQVLSSGFSNGANDVPIGPHTSLRIRPNDQIVLVIEPRDANHSCDLTQIDLMVTSLQNESSPSESWDLAQELHPNLLAGNPHADSRGRAGVWEFFTEPTLGAKQTNQSGLIPPGSLLAKWFNEPEASKRQTIVEDLQKRLIQASRAASGASKDAANAPTNEQANSDPDAVLVRRLLSASGPFFLAAIESTPILPSITPSKIPSETLGYGWPASMFGTEVAGVKLGPNEALIQGPKILEIRLPAGIAAGTELVASASLHPTAGKNGSVQLSLSDRKPEPGTAPIPETAEVSKDPNWTNVSRQWMVSSPVLVSASGEAQARTLESFERFRDLFPIALCYNKIVPVDEVVTLTLFYREDDRLRKLMLDERQSETLDNLWAQLHFVSQDALKSVDAYEQLWQFATQDADPSAFEPLREPLLRKAAEFRQTMLDAQAKHVESVLEFAQKAYRQPLTDEQRQTLWNLYKNLRNTEMPHEEAIKLLVARVLVSPEFLYRVELPKEGTDQPTNISDLELANRLSYFLWSSMPDEPLMDLARSQKLSEPETLRAQVRRMLKDPRAQRMAVEFGTMWLHIRDLDTLDEKSESHFPEFSQIRGDLYQEAILLFTDAIANDRSVLDLLSGDYTFVNGRLAHFYGIPDVGPAEASEPWQRIEGVRKYARGGILTLGATLAKQSGASRTSPILRGNWLCEVVLGEKLPKPPKNVPVLAELPPEGLTERQLTERHSSDPACSKCHQRIDPYGFAMENYDAIGRYRVRDAAGNPIDASSRLPTGEQIRSFDDLRSHLETHRKEDFVRQFNRKLLGYALGRSVQLSDEPILKEILDQQSQNSFSIQETICQIVLSKPFRQIRGKDFRDPAMEQ